MWLALLLFIGSLLCVWASSHTIFAPPSHLWESRASQSNKTAFIDDLLDKLTVEELVHQVHLTFADNVIGPSSHNELYDGYVGTAGVGVIHDWYPTNKSQFNDLQKLNLARMRVPIPFLQTGECLHGVGSFKQSIFPQQLAMAATFDPDMISHVGSAIGAEARSIGVHACFSPVLDLGKETRWGRVQEGLGEDVYLTSIMGVAYASGLSKNSTWSRSDAVIPVMKAGFPTRLCCHFAAHGSPQAGINAAPYMGYGRRQVLSEMLVPFKAAVQLGGARGVMMAYEDIDGVPCVVNPDLYSALDDWGFDGFVIGDDVAIKDLSGDNLVASNIGSVLSQWFNAGGAIQYYDYPLSVYQNVTAALIANNTVLLTTLKDRARGVLNAKWDLGLFDNPYIPDDVDSSALTTAHEELAIDAARHAIILLENRNSTLPLNPRKQSIKKIALVGPFADTLNFGDYSGPFGSGPGDRAITVRQAMLEYIGQNASNVQLVTRWGANSWLYNGQYPIPAYLLSTSNGTTGGLSATYFSDTNFSHAVTKRQEIPNRDWGLYPPSGLSSNNFSTIWEGTFTVPSDASGWIGVAIGPNSTAKLFVDDKVMVEVPFSANGNFLSNIPPLSFGESNGTLPPPGSSSFKFVSGAVHSIRIEFQSWNLFQKLENVNSVNSQIQLFWNLVDDNDPVGLATQAAKDADVIIFVGGAAWNSDGEGGDRATMGLSPNQTQLVNSLLMLDIPLVLVLEGGRPFAIPEYYSRAAAVLSTHFLGQGGGKAITDVLFGLFNPGGRLPLSVPQNVGAMPVYYNFKPKARGSSYTDITTVPTYSFGYGQSYTTFSRSNFHITTTSSQSPSSFTKEETITFHVTVENTGEVAGSDVPQVYLLQRVSSIVQPAKQLVGFSRVYLDPGESVDVAMELDPGRHLLTLDRNWNWEVEKGEYTFALLEDSRAGSDESVQVTLTCVG
ncbi:glycoside hydrolase family 3 protein [Ramaria rubella]|nr:glycoside hydrolase family 3 protein [Ramaria rubella]